MRDHRPSLLLLQAAILWVAVVLVAWASEDAPLPALRMVTLDDGSTILLNRDDQVAVVLAAEESHGLVHSPPPQMPGWPAVVGEVNSTPDVADLNGDGSLEVVFGSRQGIHSVQVNGIASPGWPVHAPVLQHVAVADVEGQGRQAVFVPSGFQFHGLRHDGTPLPGWPIATAGTAGAGVADVDGDGTVEIAAMDRNGMAHLWSPSGIEKPGWPYVFPNPLAGSNKGPALGDTDGDGNLEVAIASNEGGPVYLVSHDADLIVGFPFELPSRELREGLSMADMDRNGTEDLVFAEGGKLWFVDGRGRALPNFPVTARSGNSPPAIGDLDGDGRLETVVATIGGDAQVVVYRDDGTPYPGWPVTVPTFSFNAQATLGDIDGDGGVDIVVGGATATFSLTGRVYAWHADGSLVAGFPFSVPDGKNVLSSSVTITDLDQDGDVELVVGTITGFGGIGDGRVFAFDLAAPYDPTTMEWPTGGHDCQHTARYSPPDRRPMAVMTLPESVECTSPAGAAVTLDASASEDPDSTPGTHDDIVSFEWFEDFGLPAQTLLGTGEVLSVPLPLGTHTITLRVKDRPGATHTATATVAVLDTTAPTLEVVLDPTELWPPNHRLVPVQATVSATDTCGPAVWVLESVVSSEPDDEAGPDDGNTSGDIAGGEIGTADDSYELRAERSGSGPGRIYLVTYQATDVSGNSSSGSTSASVPHDQGGGNPEPLLLTVHETETGTRLEWAEVAGARTYNVVRGEIANLTDAGVAYSLGALVCMAEGIPEPGTEGLEDRESPGPGEAYFYLAEYDDGHPSSYGSEDAAKARDRGTPGQGCP